MSQSNSFQSSFIFLIVGFAFIFLSRFFNQKFAQNTSQNDQKDKSGQKNDTQINQKQRDEYLNSLKFPVNFAKQLKLYFGSQSGTAEKLCKNISDEAYQLNIFDKIEVVNLEDFSEQTFGQIDNELSILCVATHYEGEPCDNTIKFYKWIRDLKKQNQQTLQKLKYCVFGLGDTAYEQFNSMGIFFDKALQDVGGKRVTEAGVGNSQFLQTDQQFDEWKDQLWTRIINYYMLSNTSGQFIQKLRNQDNSFVVQNDKEKNIDLPLKMVYKNKEDMQVPKELSSLEMAGRQHSQSKKAKIIEINEQRQSTQDGSTLEVFISLLNDQNQQQVFYKTAQNLAIFPENSDEDVQKILDHLDISKKDSEKLFDFEINENYSNKKQSQVKYPFQTPCSIFQAIKQFVDLHGQIQKKTLKNFSHFCHNQDEKEKMQMLSDSKEELDKLIYSQKYGLIDILTNKNLFSSCKPSLDALFQYSQRIMPRYYTIASSNLKYPDKIRISISLTKDLIQSSDGQQYEKYGLTSQYLRKIKERYDSNGKDELIECNIFVKDSMFKIPNDPETPVVMVGPGTGIVPFIGFIEERQFIQKQTFEATFKGETFLFFGCRRPNSDFIYKETLISSTPNPITNLFVAFSRIKEENKEENNKYVQDLLKEQKERLIINLKENNGILMICGNTKMGQEVQQILKDWFGNDYVKEMEKNGRLIKELWSS